MIQVFKPKVNTERILQELRPVLESGWLGLGPQTQKFENKLAEYIGTKHVACMNSCTAALHIAIKLLNLRPGSYVATTPISFVSTNHVILQEGLVPIFCDIEETTGNISVESLKKTLMKYNVKAIMVVHLGGYSCEMDEINKLALKYNISVIEDCSHAIGGKYKGEKIGSKDNLCTWSFAAVKNLTTGDGGALSTRNQEYDKRARRLRWLGIDKDTISRTKDGYKWDYEVLELGNKYHTCDILSTIGLVELEDLDKHNERRKEIAEFYMANVSNCRKPEYKGDRESAYHFLPLFFENRSRIIKELNKNDIFPGMHYKRNDFYKCYKHVRRNDLPNTQWYQDHELTLPIHLDLTQSDLDKIINVINKC